MRGMNWKLGMVGAAGVLALGVGSAWAQAPTSYSKYDSLSDQIAVLKQQVKIAKLKAQIANAGKSPSNGGAGGAGSLPPGVGFIGRARSGGQSAVRHRAKPSLPEIVAIAGKGTQLIAELKMPAGGEVVASHGNTLSDGLVVRSVTPEGVSVVKDGKRVALPFEGSAAPAATTAHEPGDHDPSGPGVEQVR